MVELIERNDNSGKDGQTITEGKDGTMPDTLHGLATPVYLEPQSPDLEIVFPLIGHGRKAANPTHLVWLS